MDIQDIKQIAEVARIKLSDEELKTLGTEIENLLSYFAKVREINTDEVEEKAGYMHDLKNTFREDEVNEQSEEMKEQIRSEFTKREDNLLIVPKSLK